ncbi:bifunctional enoyl-CoA hydratase/phosphate acetyltransferase [Aminipila luticellarii]|uniref:Bifunctional enoyl-CoA hydratase/phosphate acetyltransferase n=1 Tax=Aminipila luticellarii TaxID=2507160 RepID=A0A410PTG6_9FIRM|nr:bifunctional enoyl-CoA hydratase/phosphate acetyltransferase [Aminipila luticellarii]QAT42225.1 bifunctional enoyl-CoA hydratase/phosphate acetyltransferase [Aminipila luticellarii]
MIHNFDELIEKVKSGNVKKRVAVVSAHDEHTLEAIDKAFQENIAEPVLIGDVEKIKDIITAHNLHLSNVEMIEEKEDRKAARKAVEMIHEKKADFIMKGKLQTADLLKEVVDKEHGLQKGGIMSHFGLFEIPGYHKLLVITDGGMVLYPDLNQKAKIIENSVQVLQSLGYEIPKVAVLSATEVVNPKMPESVDADQLKKMNQEGKLENCIVEGPISYDLMISPESAAIKGYKSPVVGDTDIAVVPNMTAGNLLAKGLMLSAGGKMAGIIVGAEVPIVIVSRGASAEEKYLSLVLSAASAEKQV